jgi:hypothetical protein
LKRELIKKGDLKGDGHAHTRGRGVAPPPPRGGLRRTLSRWLRSVTWKGRMWDAVAFAASSLRGGRKRRWRHRRRIIGV